LQIKYTKRIKISGTYENATTTVVLGMNTKNLSDIASLNVQAAQ
jgi:hypothetical protein